MIHDPGRSERGGTIPWRAMLSDFGLSTTLTSKTQLKFKQTGSPNYVSNCVLSGKGYSFPADVWSLGVMAYACLTGTPPFETARQVSKAFLNPRNSFSFLSVPDPVLFSLFLPAGGPRPLPDSKPNATERSGVCIGFY